MDNVSHGSTTVLVEIIGMMVASGTCSGCPELLLALQHEIDTAVVST